MKQEQRLNAIRNYLIQQKKATWTEISDATKIKQPKELSADLKRLLDKKEITCEQGTKDRRKTWYMLTNKKKTDAEIKRYEITEFIRGLKEPTYVEWSFESYLLSEFKPILKVKEFETICKIGLFLQDSEKLKGFIEHSEELRDVLKAKERLQKVIHDLIPIFALTDKSALTLTFEIKRNLMT